LTQGGGLHVGNRFRAVPVSGRIDIDNNVVVRGGSRDPHWRPGVGALWFYALDTPISADIQVIGNRLIDSSEEAVQFFGKPITGVTLRGLTIDSANGAAIQLQSEGAASLSHSIATGLGAAAVVRCGVAFRLRDDGGNQGFDSRARACAPGCTVKSGTRECREKRA
jgi:hypothetical protein